MIGSNLPMLDYVKEFRKSLENGTVKTARFELTNATPEAQAKLDQRFIQDEVDLKQLIKHHQANPSWATFDDQNNSVEFPDVQSLSKSDASHILNGLKHLMDIGRLDGKTINATNGGLSTNNVADYQDWLLARMGVDETA
ncbi:hypothetical protein [Pseudomonas sp. S2_E01]